MTGCKAESVFMDYRALLERFWVVLLCSALLWFV